MIQIRSGWMDCTSSSSLVLLVGVCVSSDFDSAQAFTGEGLVFLPRPRTLSGCETTMVLGAGNAWYKASNIWADISGVPSNMMVFNSIAGVMCLIIACYTFIRLCWLGLIYVRLGVCIF